MSNQYQNTARLRESGEFIQVVGGDSVVTIKAKQSKFVPAAGISLNMIAVSIRRETPKDVTPCGATCATTVTETVEVKFNVVAGISVVDFNAKLDENLRILGIAVDENFLLRGIVPPATETFVGA